MRDRIRAWYASGRWSAEQVTAAATRGWITEADAADILALANIEQPEDGA